MVLVDLGVLVVLVVPEVLVVLGRTGADYG
jgi:hypothetical protein